LACGSRNNLRPTGSDWRALPNVTTLPAHTLATKSVAPSVEQSTFLARAKDGNWMITETAIRLLGVGNLLAVLGLLEKITTGYTWVTMFLIILYICIEVTFAVNRKDL
jgi:hypothetical protein